MSEARVGSRVESEGRKKNLVNGGCAGCEEVALWFSPSGGWLQMVLIVVFGTLLTTRTLPNLPLDRLLIQMLDSAETLPGFEEFSSRVL